MFSRFTRKTVKLPPLKGVNQVQLPPLKGAAAVLLTPLQLVQPITPCNSPNISPRLSPSSNRGTPNTEPLTPSTTNASPITTEKKPIVIPENKVEFVDTVFIHPDNEDDENYVLCVKTLEPVEIVFINDVLSNVFTKTSLPYKHRHDLYWMSEDFLLQYLDYSVVIRYNHYDSVIPLYDLFTVFPINAENMALHRALEKAISELNFICYQRESAKRVVLTMICNIIYTYSGVHVKIIKYIGG